MLKSANYIKCSQCEKEFLPKSSRAKVCSDSCRRIVSNIQQNERIRKKNENLVGAAICAICGSKSNDLTSHITRMHMPVTEYKEMYPNSPIRSKKYLEEQSKRIMGDKNPAYQHGGKFSPLSDKFIHKDKIDKQDVIDKISKSNRENGNNNTTLAYWLNQGFDENEAAQKLSERQTTFSKEICIDKYGEKEGTKVWKERQIKWQKTLDDKPFDEKEEINRKKQYHRKVSETDMGKIYLVRITKDDKTYIKIGVTKTEIKTRFTTHIKDGYSVEVLHERVMKLNTCFDNEYHIINKFKSDRVIINERFCGYTECFNENMYHKLKEEINSIDG